MGYTFPLLTSKVLIFSFLHTASVFSFEDWIKIYIIIIVIIIIIIIIIITVITIPEVILLRFAFIFRGIVTLAAFVVLAVMYLNWPTGLQKHYFLNTGFAYYYYTEICVSELTACERIGLMRPLDLYREYYQLPCPQTAYQKTFDVA